MHLRFRFSFLLAVFGAVLIAGRLGAASPVIVPLVGDRFEGDLESISADGVLTFHQSAANNNAGGDNNPPRSGATRHMTLDELVRWGHPRPPQARPWVLLDDGSFLVTAGDWSGGTSVRMEDESVVALTDAFDEVKLPRGAVVGVVFDQRRHPDDRQQLARMAHEATRERDEVLLTNGDRLTGKVIEITKGSMTVAIERDQAKLPISRVRAVFFGAAPGAMASPRAQSPGESHLVVGTYDGSLLRASSIEANRDRLTIVLQDGATFRGSSIADVVFLQSLGSDRLVYLSDLEPVEYRSIPYLSLPWPWRPDRSVTGAPLMVGNARYLKGLGMHSASRLTYRLDDNDERFAAAIAIDDSAGGRGSATFAVYLLRDGKLQEAFKSDTIRGGEAPVPITVDVTGAQGMTLIVDFADRGDEMDRADWLDARLIKNDIKH